MSENPERFEIWKVRSRQRTLVASSGTAEGLGLALVTLRAEQEWSDDDSIGILDRPVEGKPGKWLVNPWAKGARTKREKV